MKLFTQGLLFWLLKGLLDIDIVFLVSAETPTACKMMFFWAGFLSFGPLCYILLGSSWAPSILPLRPNKYIRFSQGFSTA